MSEIQAASTALAEDNLTEGDPAGENAAKGGTTGDSVTEDNAVRQAIENELNSTLFVQAGAGTGKTTALVGRILSLVRSGVDVRHIAAITFTEKAASELQMRIRQKLQENAEEELCRTALADLDSANISTLHSFAQQILTEHALAAKLPLRFELLDEVASWTEFMNSWEEFLLALEDEHSFAFLLGEEMGIRTEVLKNVARKFRDNWDLLEGYKTQKPQMPTMGSIDLSAFLEAEKDINQTAANFKAQSSGQSTKSAMTAYEKSKELKKNLKAMSEAADSEDLLSFASAAFDRIFDQPKNGPLKQKIKNEFERELRLSVRDRVPELISKIRSQISEAVISYLISLLAKFTLAQAAARKEQGRLIFHDLLVLAKNLFASKNAERIQASLHNRFRYLLIDEFQDTDPIQIELTVHIAASVSQKGNLNSHVAAWDTLEVKPGQLFFVGDPKQSIYRFRRADISLYLSATKRFGPPLALTANWRSTKSIIEWVNQIFSELIEEVGGYQSGYEPLEARREVIKGDPGPPVSSFGDASDLNVNEIRLSEAEDVAKMIYKIIKEGWWVEATGEVRQARLDDICILIPNRSNLSHLEAVFSKSQIPYRVGVSNQILAANEIRDLFAVLCAIDDPSEELMVVTALRSPAFGCGDDDLYAHHKTYDHSSKRPWNYLFLEDLGPENSNPDLQGYIVGESLAWLTKMHSMRNFYSVSQLVEKVIRERCLLELALAHKNYRDIWRRLRYFSDLARKFTEETGGTLGEFLALLRQLGENQIQMDENIVPESDHNAVRIMTIHASKGLEFPIVVLANMPSNLCGQRRPGDVIWAGQQGEAGIYFKSGVTSLLYESLKDDHDTHSFSESLRKLYVACTRARDHLVISLHRKERDLPEPMKQTWAETVARAMPESKTTHYDLAKLDLPTEGLVESEASSEFDGDYQGWKTKHSELKERSYDSGALSASAISSRRDDTEPKNTEEGTEDDTPVKSYATTEDNQDAEENSANEEFRGTSVGRGADSFGKAVHSVLQSLDLAKRENPELLRKLAESQAGSFGVHEPKELEEICQLSEMALASRTVSEASQKKHWKEVYVAAPFTEEKLIYGYIDLVFQDDNGHLVIVDYKTAANAATFQNSLDKYQKQLAAYALAVEKSTGLPVSRCVLIVLLRQDKKAMEHEIPQEDLQKAKEAVRKIASS